MTAHHFKFKGGAGEYFGIWVVNLFLTIVTVGVYSAWAKVRRLRYFYANTYLDGHNFEYHARPKAILIGRAIVFSALLLYNGLLALTPIAAVLLVPYLIGVPLIINKALRFNARVTSYRNIRLNFAGSYWRALLVFVILPILAVISFGILGPVASRMKANYIGNNLSYGDAKFSTDAPLGALYGNWGGSLAFFLFIGLAFSSVGALVLPLYYDFSSLEDLARGVDIPPEYRKLLVYLMIAIFSFYLALFLAILFYSAGVRNIVYDNTTLEGGHRFSSSFRRFQYIWILVSNLVVVLATVGLMRPWAAIRTWRYKVDNTMLDANGTLDSFVATRVEEGRAASAEFLDIEGIDFGL